MTLFVNSSLTSGQTFASHCWSAHSAFHFNRNTNSTALPITGNKQGTPSTTPDAKYKASYQTVFSIKLKVDLTRSTFQTSYRYTMNVCVFMEYQFNPLNAQDVKSELFKKCKIYIFIYLCAGTRRRLRDTKHNIIKA